MSAEYRIEFVIQRRQDGEDDFTEIGFGSSGAGPNLDVSEKMYLVCANCGEAFDEIETANEHGTSDPNNKSWCGEDGFVIVPESEAL